MLRIVIISDTHTMHQQVNVPDGDVLIHAGDITGRGHSSRVKEFADWARELPHRRKVIIAGNHDFCLEDRQCGHDLLGEFDYLLDSGCEIDGLKVWGSPYQPWFHNWAFNLRGSKQLREKWDLVPGDTDILVTHCPPFGVLDKTLRGERVGCYELRDAVTSRIKPRLHVFGHIHEDYGWAENSDTLFVNGCTCTLAYEPKNRPIVVEIDGDKKPRVVSPKS